MAFFSEWPSSAEYKTIAPLAGSSTQSSPKEIERAKIALSKFDSLHKSSHLPPPRTPQRLSRAPLALEQLCHQLTLETHLMLSDGATFSLDLFRTQDQLFFQLSQLNPDPICLGIRTSIKFSVPSIFIVRISLTPHIHRVHPPKILVYYKIDDIVVRAPDERTGSSHHLVYQLISSHVKEAAHYFFDECRQDPAETRFRNFYQWLLSYKTLFVSDSLADPRTGQTRKISTPCIVCGKHLAWDETHQNLVPPTFRNFVTYEPCHSIHLS